jgi:hypothetical protein
MPLKGDITIVDREIYNCSGVFSELETAASLTTSSNRHLAPIGK